MMPSLRILILIRDYYQPPYLVFVWAPYIRPNGISTTIQNRMNLICCQKWILPFEWAEFIFLIGQCSSSLAGKILIGQCSKSCCGPNSFSFVIKNELDRKERKCDSGWNSSGPNAGHRCLSFYVFFYSIQCSAFRSLVRI